MKIIFAIIIAVSLFFTGFIISGTHQNYHPSNAEQLVNNILAKTAEIIKRKYKMQPSGEGGQCREDPFRN